MFLLFTASNHPDVWIPAYKDSRWYCLFFILCVVLSIYVVINLILAGICGSFIHQLEKQVAEKDRMRRRILGKAFSLIDNTNNGFIDKDQCFLLFKELNKYRV
ncbi:two pore calcium channel protein 1B-like [Lycium ferocissimum]|uniref:two pore calcium channel protein 1B-like n=1 Tax=Lycium ferocissimum TaxID=112874 RepID=UPI0028162D33|nr:two pore calcium channel protein 1B-like [Lycium ferocissimum]XP_059283968.1 two pore calcium channel protein 1B-like [Lycium ferocissimum]